jgi:hypothetical protein
VIFQGFKTATVRGGGIRRGWGDEVVYDGGVREGSRRKDGGRNVVRLKGIGGSLGGLLTVTPRLKRRVTAAEKAPFCCRIRNLLEGSSLGPGG